MPHRAIYAPKPVDLHVPLAAGTVLVVNPDGSRSAVVPLTPETADEVDAAMRAAGAVSVIVPAAA
jgi:hypothetical protein